MDAHGPWSDPRGAIVDAHNDLLMELVHRRQEDEPFARHWRPLLRAGGVGLQACPLYVWWDDIGDRALRSGMEQTAAFMRAVRETPDVVHVRTRAELDAAIAQDRLGLMLSIEGADVLGNDPLLLDVYHALGVRMIGLTSFQRNAYADGNGEAPGGGLSSFGRELMRQIDRLGVMVDLAHASDGTFADVLEAAERAPLLVSHTGCRALFETQRNISDEQLRQLAERGGVAGIFAVPYFLGEPRTAVARVADHVLHALDVAGADHVGLGGDFTRRLFDCPGLVRFAPWLGIDPAGAIEVVDGLAGPEGYPLLVDELRRRGVDEATLEQVMRGNFLRLFRAALPDA